ncbi:lysozyme inhibitor LprI family protein [Nitratifractor sp.]
MKELLLLPALLFSIPLFASGSRQCFDHAQSTVEMKECAYREYRYYDRLLNESYRRLIRSLPAGEREKLRKAQRTWIVYRDLECDFEAYPVHGGTAEGLLVLGCKTELTRKRAKKLQELLETP